MAVTTFDHIGKIEDKVSGKGFARRLLDRYIDAQMKKAQLRVNAYLQNLDDKALTDLGYSPADIRNIRQADSTMGLII
jgi:uncharacterized protein YjiS (DUF1127 family)